MRRAEFYRIEVTNGTAYLGYVITETRSGEFRLYTLNTESASALLDCLEQRTQPATCSGWTEISFGGTVWNTEAGIVRATDRRIRETNLVGWKRIQTEDYWYIQLKDSLALHPRAAVSESLGSSGAPRRRSRFAQTLEEFHERARGAQHSLPEVEEPEAPTIPSDPTTTISFLPPDVPMKPQPDALMVYFRRDPMTQDGKWWCVWITEDPSLAHHVGADGQRKQYAVNVAYGKLGTTGRSATVLLCNTKVEAITAAQRRFNDKIAKGYVNVESMPGRA